MPTAPIPFMNQQASGSDELSGASPVAQNVILETGGAVRRRPGIVAASSATSAVIDSTGLNGLFVTQGGVIYAVNSTIPRKVYKVGPGGSLQLGTMFGAGRPVFAETEALLLIAAGDRPQKIDLSTDATSLLGGEPPPASHILANNSRLLINDVTPGNRGRVWYSSQAGGSDTTGHQQWSKDGTISGTEGFFSAEGRPDNIVALAENTNEVFAFGTSSLQVFVPDANFAYVPAGQREYGCAAAASVIKVEQEFAWLDQYRRFVVSDGRGSQVISEAIQRTLNELATVSDCFGYRVVTGPIDCLAWTFPTDGRTFVYQKGGGWAQWMGWDTTINNYTRLAVDCHHHHDLTGEDLIGTSTGKIGMFAHAAEADFGTVFPAMVRTGFQNRGTDALKQSLKVKLVLRRGLAASGTAPLGTLRWRDRLGPWLGNMPVRFGSSGETEIAVVRHSFGTYRRRQWEFEFAGSQEFVLAGAEEDFEVLDN